MGWDTMGLLLGVFFRACWFFAHFPFSAAAAIADVAADVAPAAAWTEWYFSRFETGTISEIYAANYISELDNKALLLEAF